MRWILSATILIFSGQACAAGLNDDFDGSKIDSRKWTTQQVLSRQIEFTSPGRCGSGAISIVTKDGDNGLECEDDCQRAELRTVRGSWPTFGDEVWYAFSFMITGDVPSTGSARFVIGQWKGPGDSSPMIAQRFDNGVFHITVQDNDIRRVVAKAEGDPDALATAQDLLGGIEFNERNVNAIKALQSLDLIHRNVPEVSEKFFNQSLRQSIGPNAKEADAKALSQALGMSDNGGLVSEFRSLAFVAEPEKYIGKAEIEISPEANRPLPDPRKNWVDMVYRIKPGRTDNEYGPRHPGEVDIWANGQKIVSVKGNIGTTLKKKEPYPLTGPYFKFGTYRLRAPGTFHFEFDEFSQSPTKAGLAQLCAVP